MRQTLKVVDEQFGICSEKSIAVRRAWEKICVPVDHEDFDGCDIELSGLSNGIHYICEEDNQFKVCAKGNDLNLLPYNAFHWSIIGKNAIDYTASTGTQLGTSIDGGVCLQIVDMPEFPYYPQTVTIQLHIVGYPVISKRFPINDCDFNDPDCEDYHNNNFTNNDMPQLNRNQPSYDDSSFVKIYDIMGNLIIENTKSNILNNRDLLEPGSLYIYTYFDANNIFLGVEKIFHVD